MPINDITTGQEHILNPLCQQWLRKIKQAKEWKWERFGQYAVEGMKFYDGAHDWMWKDEERSMDGGFLKKGAAMPTFRMQVNRMFEAVAVFGPALYHRNPDVMVTPISPPMIDPMELGINPEDPQMQEAYQQIIQMQQKAASDQKLKAKLKQHYLNWLQVECDKKTHARRSITEALLKGMGILWTSMYQPRGSQIKYPFSQHISVDDIIVDPDAEYWEDVQYIARYCCHPVNIVEREYGLPPGSLKGHMQSSSAQGDMYVSKKEATRRRRRGKTHDLVEYWKVYSKNGFGDRLRKTTNDTVNKKLNFEPFGDFCKIVVAQGIPYPLNLPTSALSTEDEEQLIERVQWEIPFWTNPSGWPMSRLTFYEKPRSVWPISIVKPAVGELRFVNWCMSFLADKAAAACTTYVAQQKAAGIEIQDQIKNGMAPYTVIEISSMTGKSINDVISFLDAPNFSQDIWKMLSEVLDMIDKRTGLTDLIYGMTTNQLRSATEADIKEQNTNIRPDDMAGRVEDFLSETALNETAAMVWSCSPQDVQPVLGDIGASIFAERIQTQDFERVIRDYDYRIAAGSARKPNKQSKQRALTELGQVLMPTLQGFAMEGKVQPYNAYINEISETMDIDPSGFLLPEPPPQEGPTPEEQMMEMEMQMKQMEMQLKQAEFEMKQQATAAEMAMKQQATQEQMLLKEEDQVSQLEADEAAHAQEMDQDAEMHRQEMQQKQQEAEQDLLMKKAELAMMTEEQKIKLEGLKKMQAAQVAAKRAQARASATAKSKGSSDG